MPPIKSGGKAPQVKNYRGSHSSSVDYPEDNNKIYQTESKIKKNSMHIVDQYKMINRNYSLAENLKKRERDEIALIKKQKPLKTMFS